MTLTPKLISTIGAPRRRGHALGASLDVFGGVQRFARGDDYRWDGAARGGSAHRPYVVIQLTLDGQGVFKTPARDYPIPVDHLMLAVVPSRHVYELHRDADHWRFMWTIIDHGYFVRRMQQIVGAGLAVLRTTTDITEAMIGLLQQSLTKGDDRFARERKLFDLMLSLDAAADVQRKSPGSERETVLERVRTLIAEQGMTRPNVENIAGAFGMSRSHFSHHFRSTTGLTPAAFVREVRLSRARDEVTQSDASLKSIARATGFSDINHFCRAFRDAFSITPGAFRKQMRGRWQVQ